MREGNQNSFGAPISDLGQSILREEESKRSSESGPFRFRFAYLHH